MTKEKNWNNRWGTDAPVKNRYRNLPHIRTGQTVEKATHIADKTSGADHCVLITKSLINQLLTRKALGITTVRLNKMISGKGRSLSLYPSTRVSANGVHISAKYINKDVWEFYLE